MPNRDGDCQESTSPSLAGDATPDASIVCDYFRSSRLRAKHDQPGRTRCCRNATLVTFINSGRYIRGLEKRVPNCHRYSARNMVRSLTLLAILGAASACLGLVDELTAKEPSGGTKGEFVPLFADESFTGWHGALENYRWEEGVLQCRPTKAGNIYSDAEYADFVLQFEFRLTPAANNGIGLRVPDGGHASTDGLEIQILDDGHPRYANLKPYQMHGSVYGLIPATRGSLQPTGEWNTQEIRCLGPRVTVVLNGVTILDGDLHEATRNGTADEKEHPGASRAAGHLCLCTHGSQVDFRNLRIQVLSPTP